MHDIPSPAAEPTPEPTPAEAAELPAVAVPAPEAAAAAAAAPAAPAVPDLSPAACAARLAELFPALFGAGRALPIKLRIQADIQQRAPGIFNKKSLSIFLHRHTTSTAYLKALAQAPARLDLDGQPAGEIAAEHREAAATELARRLAIVQERRAAERQAQRQRPAPAAAAGAEGADAAPRPPRPPRPDRPPRPQGDRPPRPQGDRPPRPQGDRPPRPQGDRPPRPQGDRPPRPDRSARPARPPQPQRPPRAAPEAAAPQAPQAPREPLTPEQAAEWEARRSRAQLLRAFETTTLTRANFCALKGMKDDALEALLVQARAERSERPPRA